MLLKDRLALVDAALADWISGEIIASKTHETFPERMIVVKSDDTYAVLRGFMITGAAHVSVDLEDASADQAIAFLMEKVDI